MNVLDIYKNEGKYIPLLEHHRFIQEEAKRKMEESISNICDYYETISKTKGFKNKLLKEYRQDPYQGFYEMALISIMIQALDKKSLKLGSDYRDETEKCYDYDPNSFDFNDSKLDEWISEIWRTGFYDCSASDMYHFRIDLAVNPMKNNIYSSISIIEDDLEYADDDGYETVFIVKKEYERAIRALYESILSIKDEVKALLLEHIEEERVEYDD